MWGWIRWPLRVAVWSVVVVPLLYIFFTLVTPYSRDKLPSLQTGDIVFQTINTSQTLAIMFATRSIYSHVGVVEVYEGRPMVVEAVGPVRWIPFDAWVRQGIGDRVTVGRVEGLTEAEGKAVIAAAKRYLGKPYDYFFLDSDDAIYCSELVHKAFVSGAGMQLGVAEKVGDLYVDNFAVKQLIEKRWKAYPPCNGIADFSQCYRRIMEQTLVSPASQRNDPKLHVIYSNFGL